MIKVLAVATHFDLSESNILAGLARAGISIECIMDPARNNVAVLEAAHIPCSTLPIRSRFDFRAIQELRRKANDGSFDIIHCFSSRALSSVLMATCGMRVRRIAYRGTIGHLSRFDPSAWFSYLNPGVHKIICASNAVHDYLATMIPEDRLITIYKGHDVAWYTPPPDRVALATFGIPAESFVVACVANVRPVKGVKYLIEAWQHIPDSLPIHLLLVGHLDESTRRFALNAAGYSRVHFAGFRSDVPSIVSQCQIFALPSVAREGLPKALIEAMALSITPIATSVGGIPEVVSHEQDGLLVPPRSGAALAKAILRLFHDPALAERLRYRARETIVERFNIETSVSQIAQLYRTLTC